MDVLRDLYLALSTIFFFWLGRLVWTLRKTVTAQARTIDAFKSLLDGMRSVLESTDETKMLARLEAHKKFVDHEMETYKKKVHEEMGNTLKNALKGSEAAIRKTVQEDYELLYKVLGLVARLMPYVPPEERSAQIEATNFGGTHEKIKETVTSIAAKAHYTSDEDIERNREFVQTISRMFQQADIPSPLPPSPKKD